MFNAFCKSVSFVYLYYIIVKYISYWYFNTLLFIRKSGESNLFRNNWNHLYADGQVHTKSTPLSRDDFFSRKLNAKKPFAVSSRVPSNHHNRRTIFYADFTRKYIIYRRPFVSHASLVDDDSVSKQKKIKIKNYAYFIIIPRTTREHSISVFAHVRIIRMFLLVLPNLSRRNY